MHILAQPCLIRKSITYFGAPTFSFPQTQQQNIFEHPNVLFVKQQDEYTTSSISSRGNIQVLLKSVVCSLQ
jgi:hypothetical protein